MCLSLSVTIALESLYDTQADDSLLLPTRLSASPSSARHHLQWPEPNKLHARQQVALLGHLSVLGGCKTYILTN